jgi:hypothetical protein
VTKNIGIYRKTLRDGTDWSVIPSEEE